MPRKARTKNPAARYLYPSLNESLLTSIWNETLCQQIEAQLMEESRKPCRRLPASPDGRDHAPLYKYRTFDPSHEERLKDAVVDGRLWSPSIEQLNDPMEAAVVFGNEESEDWATSAATMLLNSPWCGCVCFSYDPVCPQMWAYYAGSHSGFILKYEREKNFVLRSSNCRPVKYRRAISVLDLQTDEDFRTPLWTKSEAWEFEREVRLLYPRTNAYTAPGLLAPSGVIFGLRTPDSAKQLLRRIGQGLRFGQIVFGDQPYRLKVDWHD